MVREVGVRPAPVGAVAVAAIVSLQPKAEGLARKAFSIESDLALENGVRMRRLGKADPAPVAQYRTEIGCVAKLPGNRVASDADGSPTSAFFDPDFGDAPVKGKLSRTAQFQRLGRIALAERARPTPLREPRGPHLHGHARGMRAAAGATKVHQEVAEPPRSTAIGQATAQKPHLVSALHAARRIDRIQGSLIHVCLRVCRWPRLTNPTAWPEDAVPLLVSHPSDTP